MKVSEYDPRFSLSKSIMAYQIVSKKQNSLLLSWDGKHQDSTNRRHYTHARDNEAFSLSARSYPTGTHYSDNLNDTKGNVE